MPDDRILLALVRDYAVVDGRIAALELLQIVHAVDHAAEGGEIAVEAAWRLTDHDVELGRGRIGLVRRGRRQTCPGNG